MDSDWIWWTAAIALSVLEAFVGTFHLLVLAAACVLGGALAHFGADAMLQLGASLAMVLVGGVVRGRLVRRDLDHGVVLAAHPNQLIEIGASVHVAQWRNDRTAQVSSRGRHWEAVLREDQEWPARSGAYVIAGVRNARIILIQPPRRDARHPAAR